MAVNSSVEKQPVDQQASGEVQAEIDTRSDGVSPMPNDVSKHNDVSSIRWRPFPNRRCRWPILSVSARILHCGWLMRCW